MVPSRENGCNNFPQKLIRRYLHAKNQIHPKSSPENYIESPSKMKRSSGDEVFRVSKRNPTCIRRCLQKKILHPAQCHFLC